MFTINFQEMLDVRERGRLLKLLSLPLRSHSRNLKGFRQHKGLVSTGGKPLSLFDYYKTHTTL